MDPKDITKEYTNGELTVVWQAGKCIHSGNCVRNNPDVFQPKEKPWIKIEASSSEKNKRNGRQMSIGCIDLFSKHSLALKSKRLNSILLNSTFYHYK